MLIAYQTRYCRNVLVDTDKFIGGESRGCEELMRT